MAVKGLGKIMRFVEFNLILNDKTTCDKFEGKGRGGGTFLLNGNVSI